MALTEMCNGRKVTFYRRADLDDEAKGVVARYRQNMRAQGERGRVKLDFWQLEVSGDWTARLAVHVKLMPFALFKPDGKGIETTTLYHVL